MTASHVRSRLRRSLVILLAALSSGCAGAPAPDLVITNSRVFTNDTARPWIEALATKGERVVAVGTREAIAALAGPSTRVIDAGGRVVVPGFNDARVDLPLEPPTPSALAALDRDALARGVTSLQVVAGGPMRALVDAARRASRQARWRLIRSPEDGERPRDDGPFLPPQPGVRLAANGVAWTTVAHDGRRALEPTRLSTVVGWAYGAEDPLVMAGSPRAWVSELASVGVAEVWQRKRPRLDLLGPIDGGGIDGLSRLGAVVTWLPTTRGRPPEGPGPEPPRLSGAAPGAFVDGGLVLALGSAGQPDPMTAIAVVSASAPLTSWRPLSREEAVRAATWGSAYAEKAERDKGWLGAGALADFVVLSDDVFMVPADRLATLRSVLTVIGGAIVYDSGVLPRR